MSIQVLQHSEILGVCVCVYIHMLTHIHMCVLVHVKAHGYGSQKSAPVAFPQQLPTLVVETKSLIGLELAQ